MDVEHPQLDGRDTNRDTWSTPMEEENSGLIERARKVDDYSSAIASKLLEGWTLLNEHCPACYTPLVRNRQKKMKCVACNQWVVTEEELASKLQEQRVKESRESIETSQIDTPLTSDETSILRSTNLPFSHIPSAGEASGRSSGGNHVRVASRRDQDQEAEERSSKRLEVFPGVGAVRQVEILNKGQEDVSCPPASSLSKGCMLPKVDLAVVPAAVLRSTMSTLFQKMEEIRQLIAVSQDIHGLRQLLNALAACVQAIAGVKSLIKEVEHL